MKANYDDARSVLRRLTARGHKSYLAGGCVRDIILGYEPNDYDVATSATPEEVQSIFERTVPVGISFGVVKVIWDGREIDVATFRTDGKYSDNRRPDSVTFTPSAEEDVKRRDFTINALLMDVNGKIIDYVGGEKDIKARVIRTVGDPMDRFREDALRMMRAVRFSTRFGFKIEDETAAAIRSLACIIKNISIERVTDELTKMFSYGQCDLVFWQLNSLKLWDRWFKDKPSKDQSWEAMFGLSRVRPDESFILPLAIIICEAWGDVKKETMTRLSLTNVQREGLESLLGRAARMSEFLMQSLSIKRKMMQWEDKELILRFIGCQRHIKKYQWDLNPEHPHVEDVFTHMKEIENMGWPAPLITGEDLIGWGFIPHKVFTEILDDIRTEQLEGRLLDKSKVKDFVLLKFPAAPRTLPNGTRHDGMSRQTMVSTCKDCSRSMRFTAEFDCKGQVMWNTVQDITNIIGMGAGGTYIECGHCYVRKKKTKFVRAVL